MLGFIKEVQETVFGESYRRAVDNVFKYTLKRDLEKKMKYKGYPSPQARFLALKSRTLGIKLVDEDNKDFTFAPLLKQYSSYLGGQNSLLYRSLENLNMKIFGGFLKATKLNYQIRFLESYKEYAQGFQTISILENIMDKEIPFYLLKILREFYTHASKSGMTLKTFILKNPEYFKEIVLYFDFEDKPELQCLDDALEEIKARRQAVLRDYLLKNSLLGAGFDLVLMIIVFGKKMIPDLLESFDASINDFSTPIQVLDRVSHFLINRWYLAVILFSILYVIGRTKTVRLIIGFSSVKIPGVKDYIVNDQLLRFLKSYINIINFDSMRNAYKQSLKMVSNEYLRYSLEVHVNQSSGDIGDTGVTFYKVLESIPYIPKEYVDMIKESELIGKPEEGIRKVIELIDPKIENLVKKVNKQIILGVMIFSALVSLLIFAILYRDMNIVINSYNQDFIDNLRN